MIGLFLLSSCRTHADKRILQYLNKDGFGKRYTGNPEEENYITLGDSLQVTDSIHPEELRATGTVDIDGTVIMPELGAVQVAGMTRTELEAMLTEKYSAYYDELDIKVRIIDKGKVYYLFGETTREGAQKFTGDLTIWEAVMLNRPDMRSSNLGRVRLIRADPIDPLIITVDIAAMIETGDSTFNVHVQEGDIVYVPPTILAQLGYFIEALLFPVNQVIASVSRALGSGNRFNRLGNQGGGGGFGGGGFGGGGGNFIF